MCELESVLSVPYGENAELRNEIPMTRDEFLEVVWIPDEDLVSSRRDTRHWTNFNGACEDAYSNETRRFHLDLLFLYFVSPSFGWLEVS